MFGKHAELIVPHAPVHIAGVEENEAMSFAHLFIVQLCAIRLYITRLNLPCFAHFLAPCVELSRRTRLAGNTWVGWQSAAGALPANPCIPSEARAPRKAIFETPGIM